ncbi:MAG: hypothetical protein CSB23_04200 [Deltaproteobacteria bacterium]|nr:MAG: hypothetical protein CSB23_04200 [Deltaproteobacteria bacterium]
MKRTSLSPKITMTLLVRDEEDIIEDNIWYHFSQGVNSFIIMDNRSSDNTAAIISRLSNYIDIEYIYQPADDYNQAEWVTSMARRACTEFEAEWVINNDADEFWFYKNGLISDFIASLPEEVSVVEVSRLNAVLLNLNDNPMASETHPRQTTLFEKKSKNSQGHPLPPKCFHRASPDIVVSQGNHSVDNLSGETIQESQMIIFHYPYRTFTHYKRKILLGGAAYERNTKLPKFVGETWRKHYAKMKSGKLESFWRDTSFSLQNATIKILDNSFITDRTMIKEIENSDGIRSRTILAKEASELLTKSSTAVAAKKAELLQQIESLPLNKRDRFYENTPFCIAGMENHLAFISDLDKQIRLENIPKLDELRDIFSLFPANNFFWDFLRSYFITVNHKEAYKLAQEIKDKNVIVHLSCNKNILPAKDSFYSFKKIDDKFPNIIVVGNEEATGGQATEKLFGYTDRILKVPTPDTYENLHEKMFYAILTIFLVGPPRSIVKIDDNLHLDDARIFTQTIENFLSSQSCCSGRVVGTRQHDSQWHGWHIGKCTDETMNTRGYTYPLPRRYPAGGYGYILNTAGLEACAKMFMSMKEFFRMDAVGLEDAVVGHALYAYEKEITDITDDNSLLAFPGLKPT